MWAGTCCRALNTSLVPRLLPCRKTGESLEKLITCPVTYYAWFYAWFELLPTQSVLRVRCWSSGSMDIAETTDGHWKHSLVSCVASTLL